MVLDQQTDIDLGARARGSAMTIVVVGLHIVASLEKCIDQTFKTSRMLSITVGDKDMSIGLVELCSPRRDVHVSIVTARDTL